MTSRTICALNSPEYFTADTVFILSTQGKKYSPNPIKTTRPIVCNNGTWASRFDSPSPSDTEILNKAAEL